MDFIGLRHQVKVKVSARSLKAFIKYFMSLVLIQTSILLTPMKRSLVLARSSPEQNINIDFLLSAHQSLKTKFNDPDQFHSAAEKLLKLTDQYLENLEKSKNKDELNSSKAKDLLTHHKVLSNLVATKNKLDICVKDPDNKLSFTQKITAFNFDYYSKIESDCSPCLVPSSSSPLATKPLKIEVDKIESHTLEVLFANKLERQILTNAAEALLKFKYKFDPQFMKKGQLSASDLKSVMSQICMGDVHSRIARKFNACNDIDKSFQQDLEKTLKSKSEVLAKEKKMDLNDATLALNASIDRLNQSLNHVKLERHYGVYLDSPQMASDEARQKFNFYTLQYLEEITHDAGALLVTDKIKGKAGAIKEYKESYTKRDGKKHIFTPHYKVSASDVKAAIKEVDKMLEQQNVANQKTILGGYKTDTLNTLIEANPLALGQILIHHPEFLDLTCKKINEIHLNKKIGDEMLGFATHLSSTVGITALLTSISIGALVLIAKRTAVQVGTWAGSIAGYSNLAMGVGETIHLGTYGYEAYSTQKESKGLRKSYLSGNNDPQAIVASKQAENAYEAAKTNFVIAFMIAGYTLPTANHFLHLLTGSKSASVEKFMSTHTKLLNFLATHQAVLRLKRIKDFFDVDDTDMTIKRLSEAGEEKIDQFLKHLSTLDEAELDKLFTQFNDEKVSDKYFIQLIRNAKSKSESDEPLKN